MEEGNDGTFKLSAVASVDGCRAKSLPDNGLADIGGDEKRDTGTKTVALLKQLVQQQYNQTSNKELWGQRVRGDLKVLGETIK